MVSTLTLIIVAPVLAGVGAFLAYIYCRPRRRGSQQNRHIQHVRQPQQIQYQTQYKPSNPNDKIPIATIIQQQPVVVTQPRPSDIHGGIAFG